MDAACLWMLDLFAVFKTHWWPRSVNALWSGCCLFKKSPISILNLIKINIPWTFYLYYFLDFIYLYLKYSVFDTQVKGLICLVYNVYNVFNVFNFYYNIKVNATDSFQQIRRGSFSNLVIVLYGWAGIRQDIQWH